MGTVAVSRPSVWVLAGCCTSSARACLRVRRGGQRSGYGINNAGQIAVVVNDPWNGVGRASVYSGGQITYLGTLGGDTSAAFGINDPGAVTGLSSTADGQAHAFLYSIGLMKDLGTLTGYCVSVGFTVNHTGQVSGNVSVSGNAFLYTNGRMIDINTLGSNIVLVSVSTVPAR